MVLLIPGISVFAQDTACVVYKQIDEVENEACH